MSSTSATLRKALLDFYFGGVALMPPANLFAGLLTTMPANDGTGYVEAAGGGYTRVQVPNDESSFPAANDSATKSLGVTITFPGATGDQGTAIGFALFDAADGGTVKAWATLTTPLHITSGMTVYLSPGDYSIQFV